MIHEDGFSSERFPRASRYHPEFGVEQERSSLVAHVKFRGALAMKWWLLLN